MEPVPLSAKELIFDPSGALAGIVAQTPADVDALRAQAGDAPVGVLVSAKWDGDEDDWEQETVIDSFKPLLNDCQEAKADFVLLELCQSFRALRAAALAVSDVSGQAVMALLNVKDDGLLEGGTEPLAALGVLQRIGAGSICFSAAALETTAETLEAVAPYAHAPLGARLSPDWLAQGTPLYNAEMFLPRSREESAALSSALSHAGAPGHAAQDAEVLLAPDGRLAHLIDPTLDITDPVRLSEHLGEALLELEEQTTGAVKLLIDCEEDIICLEKNQYMLQRPVCLAAENPELLEKALRVYSGLALYDGTWELDAHILSYLSRKYGLILL